MTEQEEHKLCGQTDWGFSSGSITGFLGQVTDLLSCVPNLSNGGNAGPAWWYWEKGANYYSRKAPSTQPGTVGPEYMAGPSR